MLLDASRRRVRLAPHASRFMSLFDKMFSYGSDSAAKKTSAGSSGYQLALLGYVAGTMLPKDSMQRIMNNDPGYLMGHVLVGASECLYPRFHNESKDAVRRAEAAKALIASGAAPSKTETLHVHALDALVGGRYREASAAYEMILRHDAKDLLAIKCAVDIYELLGDARNMQDTISRVLPYWQASHQGYSHLLSMQAFALQERGDFGAAEALAHRSMSMNDEDGSAFHALLHVLECQGKHQDGASLALRHQDAWSDFVVLKSHLTIHWMRFLIETGRFDRVVALLRNDVFVSDELLSSKVLVDITQVYWRLRFAGFDVPFVLEELDRQWSAVVKDTDTVPLSPLATVHAHSVFSLVRPSTGAPRITEAWFACDVESLHATWGTSSAVEGTSIDRIVQFSHRLPGNGEVHVVTTLLDAFSAYGKGQYNEAVNKLLAVRGHLHVVGGTRVEAELFECLLFDSARASSQLDLAKLILHERLNVKPQSAQYWKSYGDITEDLKEDDVVDGARRMSYVLGLGQAGTNAA
ncbi:hypothetical protein, variant [Aphanomyces invadans]|uniref:Tetratricopeptide repeat protein 38 n=1 Tax=Aphanomyces invadans TaxID=157072 RepID=A0A024TM74_9STRA|nr:hypothetical protein, variant [Aphanomyces invadans]ETV95260.1 hypothetical protein, variant [Aphanomyces invadans]|eukprot:XP_008875961.1 hypothetical protein, variant [Aphanomyces invadans]